VSHTARGGAEKGFVALEKRWREELRDSLGALKYCVISVEPPATLGLELHVVYQLRECVDIREERRLLSDEGGAMLCRVVQCWMRMYDNTIHSPSPFSFKTFSMVNKEWLKVRSFRRKRRRRRQMNEEHLLLELLDDLRRRGEGLEPTADRIVKKEGVEIVSVTHQFHQSACR
jgi:hypothetical protein